MAGRLSFAAVATFDQLSADQRAIIELVLQRGQSYSDLADTLGMPAARVRTLAREALGELAPATARDVEADWRDQVADYLLNQQSGPEATATRGHLRRSEPARAWARSLLDSLDELYGKDAPTIPEGGRGGRPPRARKGTDGGEKSARKPLFPAGDETGRRRRLIAGGVLGALLLVLLPLSLILGQGVAFLGGGDDEKKKDDTQAASNETPRPIGQVVLKGVDGARGEGRAVIAERGGKRFLIVQAQLPENKNNREVYEVWLYNSRNEAMSIGAQRADAQGNFAGAGPLPKDADKFRFIDISREAVDRNQKHSGKSVLRGRLDQLQPVPQNTGQSGQGAPQGAAPQGAAPQAPAPQAPAPQAPVPQGP